MTRQHTDISYVAQGYLARRPHTEFEISQKLAKRFSPDQISSLISKLKKSNLINDADFADTYVAHTIQQKPVGPHWLASKLRHKGVDREIIQTALIKHLSPEKESQLRRQAIEKFNRLYPDQTSNSIKLARHLAAKGFNYVDV